MKTTVVAKTVTIGMVVRMLTYDYLEVVRYYSLYKNLKPLVFSTQYRYSPYPNYFEDETLLLNQPKVNQCNWKCI